MVEDRADAGEDDEREPRRLEPRVQAPEHERQLPVARHRVRDPRGADHARVRRDEEDRRGEHADVHLEPVQQRPLLDPEVLHDAEDRIVREAALLRGQAEVRDPVAVGVLVDRQRRERDERQREVDREDGARDELVRLRDVAGRVARLFGEVRHRLDAGVREHRDRDRDEELAPRRCDAELDVVDEDLRAEDQDEADDHEKRLRREVDHREQDVQVRGLLDADDVDPDEEDDHDRAADDVPRVRAQRLPEDRQVVRHEERRDRDGRDVDEHLRPRGAEADELVERVPREARRAAGLGVADGSLRVRDGGRSEDQPRDREDDRRQAERVARGDAERVVDRGADVPVGGREERRRPEDALERSLLATPPRHGRLYGGDLTVRRRRCGSRRAAAGGGLPPEAAAAGPPLLGSRLSRESRRSGG